MIHLSVAIISVAIIAASTVSHAVGSGGIFDATGGLVLIFAGWWFWHHRDGGPFR